MRLTFEKLKTKVKKIFPSEFKSLNRSANYDDLLRITVSHCSYNQLLKIRRLFNDDTVMIYANLDEFPFLDLIVNYSFDKE